MAVSPLLNFLREAMRYIDVDPSALDQAGTSGQSAAKYHKRIVISAAVFGALAAIAGTTCIALDIANHPDEKGMLILAPLIFGAMGMIFGVAIACAVAPHEFLAGPVGLKWMTLIGTKSVFVARLVCGFIALIGLGAMAAVTLVLIFQK